MNVVSKKHIPSPKENIFSGQGKIQETVAGIFIWCKKWSNNLPDRGGG